MFYTVADLLSRSYDNIASYAVAEQSGESGMSVEHLREMMRERYDVMKQSVQKGLDPGLRSVSGLTGGQAPRLQAYRSHALLGTLGGRAAAYALAIAECNACMGRVVAAPTAGSCGILPGCLIAMQEEKHLKEDMMIDALFIAASFGHIIAIRGTLSGAEGGCQAECGSASAMAAAALVFLHGGSGVMSAHACSFALMNSLGLVCDPAGGLVEIPCVYRNVGGVGNAFTAADMALAGITCPIPCDELILAMKEVGSSLPPSLRETGEGGCASCPSMMHFFPN
jgi:L-serine dehydratase